MSLALALFALVAFVDATSNTTQCPRGCRCDAIFTFDNRSAVICGYRTEDVKHLSGESYSFLSANDFIENLSSLAIWNTSMTRFPTSVCQLLNLRVLYLDGNNLTEVPYECLTNQTKLQGLSLHHNSITDLHDGTFDRQQSLRLLVVSYNRITDIHNGTFYGLQSLKYLDLSHNQITGLYDGTFDGLHSLKYLFLAFNQIAFIGLRVFSDPTHLTNLRTLDLKFNKLTSLEPWWYYRCIHGKPGSAVYIYLQYNLISNFTNKLQFNYQCNMLRPLGVVYLGYNPIAHVMDILNGWNITLHSFFTCLNHFVKDTVMVTFDIRGIDLACDCIDFDLFRKARNKSNEAILVQNTNCNKCNLYHNSTRSIHASTIPLSDFVCDLSDRCPSSCQCVYRPDNATLHVYCSAANLSSLPLDLPPLPKSDVQYKLDFSKNKLIRRLEHRPYFVNTSDLDVSNCSLTEITTEELSHFSVVNFRGNLLQSFPREADTVNISAKLLLGLNPWRCSCDNSWMIQWLQSLSGQILDQGDIVCRYPATMYGRNVLKSTENDFCVNAVQRPWVIAFSVVAAIVVLFLVLVIIGILFYKLREKCYKRWKFHPFDRDECVGEDMDYDVFLCCSSEDEDTHALRILELMESNGYRVCYHERDFLPGSLITDNMGQSIESSKRTVCLISNNFLRSSYCMTEFDMAYHHNVAVKRKNRLIVLMMLDNPTDLYANDASDTATLRQFLRQYTYIDYTADDWLDKLLYALPVRGLLQHNDDRNDDDVDLLDNIQMQ